MYRIRAYRNHAVNAVSKRYRKALSGATLSSVAFDKIDRSASADSVMVSHNDAKNRRYRRERKRDIQPMQT
jgi:hypothetical protein